MGRLFLAPTRWSEKARAARLVRSLAVALACALLVTGCQPRVDRPTLESCSMLPAFTSYDGADAVDVVVHVENQMRDAFDPTRLCVAVDGRSLRDASTAPPFLRAHRAVEMRIKLRPSTTHHAVIVGDFAGAAPVSRGFRFEVASAHDFDPAELERNMLVARYEERGGPRTPYEQRPTMEWSKRRAPSPTDASADQANGHDD